MVELAVNEVLSIVNSCRVKLADIRKVFYHRLLGLKMETIFTKDPVVNAVINSLIIKYQYRHKTDFNESGLQNAIALEINEHDLLGEHLVIFMGIDYDYMITIPKDIDKEVSKYRKNLIEPLIETELNYAIAAFGKN